MTPPSPRLLSLWPSHVLIDQLDELEDVRESLAQQAERFYERHTQNAAKLSHRADTVSMMCEQPSAELLRLLACIEDRVASYVRQAYPSLEPSDLAMTYNTFVNRQRGLGKWAIPHRHVGNQLVATYYPRVHLGSSEGRDAVGMPGALCFHDPTPRAGQLDAPAPKQALRTDAPSRGVVHVAGLSGAFHISAVRSRKQQGRHRYQCPLHPP